MQVGCPHREIRVTSEAHSQVEITRRRVSVASTTLTGEADTLSLAHAGGDFNLIGVGAFGFAVHAGST